jgi:hypothetical protein
MGARHFSNPVSLSRKIMEKSYHCALSGEGALRFAERIGFPICDPNDLIDEEIEERTRAFTNERYLDIIKSYDGTPVAAEIARDPYNYDSASAVALDSNGHFACAISTGNIKKIGLHNSIYKIGKNIYCLMDSIRLPYFKTKLTSVVLPDRKCLNHAQNEMLKSH